jgi:hypothetical protein
MVRIRLPGHGPGGRNVDILILYDGAGSQVQRHEPEGISACVFGSRERDCAAGCPVAQRGNRARNLNCLAVGRADGLVEGDGDGSGGRTGSGSGGAALGAALGCRTRRRRRSGFRAR